MKKLFIIIVTFWCLISSCVFKSNKSPLEFKTKDISASRIVNLEDYGILNAMSVSCYDSVYIFSDWSVNEDMIAILPKDLSSKPILSGSRNDGPDGLTEPFFVKSADDGILVISKHPSKVLSLSHITGKLSYVKSYPDGIGHFFFFFNSHVYISSCRPVQDSCWLCYGDIYEGVVQRIDYPDDKVLKELTKVQQSMVYTNSRVSISPDKKHFATSTLCTGIMALGSIGEGAIKLTTINNFHSPEIERVNGFRISYGGNSIRGFTANAATNKHALFLYSPYTENNPGPEDSYNTNNILVYKWDGTHEVNLRVKEQLSFIGYDAKRNLIYGLVHNPEVQLVEYDLNGIL